MDPVIFDILYLVFIAYSHFHLVPCLQQAIKFGSGAATSCITPDRLSMVNLGSQRCQVARMFHTPALSAVSYHPITTLCHPIAIAQCIVQSSHSYDTPTTRAIEA